MGKRKKKRTHAEPDPEADAKVPKSIVYKSGKVGRSIAHLVHDMRKVMSPYTAERLQESKKNRLKDFLDVANMLGVTHMMSFSQSEVATNLRVLRCPRGPTLTFRVMSYSLMSDVVALQRRPHSHGAEFRSPPLVVLNNFGGKEDYKQIMAVMFQNMFPPINMQTIKLSECRRVVLFNLDAETGEIDMRHYVINASPVGLTRSIKKIVKAKIPDLHKYADISEFVLGANDLSDSEVEDTPESRVTLPQDFSGRGNKKSQKSALRLQELGPRLRLKLLKIEEQVCDGRVLYHAFVEKTPEEVERMQQVKAAKAAEKERRRQEQAANLEKKQKKSRRQRVKTDDGDQSESGSDDDNRESDSESDDAHDDAPDVDDDESVDGEHGDAEDVSGDDDSIGSDVIDDEFPSEQSESEEEAPPPPKQRKTAPTKSAPPKAAPSGKAGFAFVKKQKK